MAKITVGIARAKGKMSHHWGMFAHLPDCDRHQERSPGFSPYEWRRD